jgi:OOP family OmpA-OmpF porin
VASGGAANAAQINGWYVSLEGGANWIEDWNHHIFTTVPAQASFDTGWTVLASVGHAWDSWRVEFEAGYRHNELDAYSITGIPITSVSADTWEATFMINALYDLALTDDLSISLGVGAGGDFANADASLGPFSFEDDDWNFAYQGIAGINYAIGRQTALFVNYRYMRVMDPEFNFTPSVPFVLTNGDDLVKHAVTIGIRYAFEGRQAYVEAAPPPPPPAPMSAAPRQFIVFFGFNKYNLTSEALRVISEAVVAAKDTGSASVLITGHTDTVGSPQYNQQLSMRRSNAVKGEMVRQGVPTSAITSTGKGETELLVQTADGVKEPQNRRATIDLN